MGNIFWVLVLTLLALEVGITISDFLDDDTI